MVALGLFLILSGIASCMAANEGEELELETDTPKKTVFDTAYSALSMNGNKVCGSYELKPLTGAGIRCSENVRLSLQQSNEHILMIAPSGAGKSRKFIIPNVNSLENCSIVVTDPCGEIERNCDTRKKKYIINPFSEHTVGYDPLLNCRSEFEVRKLAKVILMNGSQSSRKGASTNHQDWIEMATPLFTAYLLYCYYSKKYNFKEVIEKVCTMPILPIKDRRDCSSILAEIMGDKYDSPKVELESFLQVVGASQTLSSIRSVLNTCLQIFLDRNVQSLFEKPNLDFDKLRKEESILFVQIPERHAEYFAPLTATLMSQLIDRLLDNDGLQVYMLFDEFTNIGFLPDMTKLLSTARKHRLSIVAAIQSLTQLFRVYGEVEGKELQELFKTLLITNGLKDSSEYVSKLVGNHTVKDKVLPLMSEDDIRRMDRDEILIICNNKRPVMDSMIS